MAEILDNSMLLAQILAAVSQIQNDNKALAASVDAINGRVNALADVKKLKDAVRADTTIQSSAPVSMSTEAPTTPTTEVKDEDAASKRPATSRIILTTYPGQSGIDPIIMNWGHKDPMQRGPVVVSRAGSTVRRRNGRSTLILMYNFYLLSCLLFIFAFYYTFVCFIYFSLLPANIFDLSHSNWRSWWLV